MIKNLVFSSLLLSTAICGAQTVANSASVLTPNQSSRVAKVIRQHNVIMDFCGCCESSKPQCIQVSDVKHDSISVSVIGIDIATGKKYSKTIDVAETWIPVMVGKQVKKMACVGRSAGVNCEPCTEPSVPTGSVGEKMLALELDGLMETDPRPVKIEGKSEMKQSKSSVDKDLKAQKSKDLDLKKQPDAKKKLIGMEKLQPRKTEALKKLKRDE